MGSPRTSESSPWPVGRFSGGAFAQSLVFPAACAYRLMQAAVLGLLLAPAWLWGQEAAAPREEPTGWAAAMALETVVVDAVARAERSVVAIARERPRDNPRPNDEGPQFFAERSPEDPEYVPQEFGAGVVIDRSGLIVTNHHVLGDPTKNRYWVWVNRRPYLAEVKAADPWLDLAVLKIAAENLEPIRFGDGKAVKKGQFVVALGNPYAVARDGQPSATWGIVSNISRKAPPVAGRPAEAGSETLHHYGTLIQVDCRLQWGASGGALINLKGELVGLTTALAALEGYEASAGFAIPVDDVFRRTLETLKSGRKPEYGFLGVAPELLTIPERQRGERGVRVRQIVPGTPAARSDLKIGDVIVGVGGTPIVDSADLIRELSGHPADARIRLAVLRPDTNRPDAKSTGKKPGALRESEVPVELSKKFVGGTRQPYSLVPDRQWRGLKVEYSTAIPQFEERLGELDPEGCVAVIEVAPESAAWRAGLRPGGFVSHVDGQRVQRPTEFFTAVEGKAGSVRLKVTGVKTAGFKESDAIRVVDPET
jgi:serine protease Do